MYSQRFWKKNWDEGVTDIDPEEFEKTYNEIIQPAFDDFPDNVAFSYIDVEVTYAELDKYANQFANMLIGNGFQKGDIIGINLPQICLNI